MLDNVLNQPSKFRTKSWVEINDDARRIYNTNSQIKFKTTLFNSSLHDYSDICMVFKKTISVANTVATESDTNNEDKEVIFKNCTPFTE